MLDSVDKTLLLVKTIDFYETPSVYHSNTTLYGGGGKLGMEKCEKSAIRSSNFGNDCRLPRNSYTIYVKVTSVLREYCNFKYIRLISFLKS